MSIASIKTACQACRQGIPLQRGIHVYETEDNQIELTRCERCDLTLEPIELDASWHQPNKRNAAKVPFVVGGAR